MISLGVPPSTRYDLHLTWPLTQDGRSETQAALLRGLVCAPEDQGGAHATPNPATPEPQTP